MFVFATYIPYFYSNFDQESLLDAELNSTSNEYPLDILCMGSATPKTRNTWKNVCRVGTRWMQNLISHLGRSPDRNLSKHTWRYVKNTNKKVGFFMIAIPKFILKKCLRPIRYFKFKSISLANTWWHGIWIMVKGPFWVEISSNEEYPLSSAS